MSSVIKSIKAREILDSRGNPTVEVDLETEGCGMFRAAVPSGASTGIYEALELRDKDEKRYLGKGVLKAVANVNDVIAPKLIGKDVKDQAALDKFMVEELDGSTGEWGWSKSKLGANAILAISMAICRAGAAANKIPLYQYISRLAGRSEESFIMPCPAFNVLNGGTHAGNSLAFQEFMIMPTGAENFKDALRMGAEVYHHLKKVINKKYGLDATNVGDEGGFAPNINDHHEALVLIDQAIKNSGHEGKIKLACDVAASELFTEDKMYDLDFKNPKKDGSKKISADAMIEEYKKMVEKYPFVLIEDPFDQDDWAAWTKMTAAMGDKYEIVGDDLLVTNPTRVKVGLEKKSCNALLLKVNQIGSVTESIDACNLARDNDWAVFVSHRSGETEDTFIADIVVGLRTGHIKTGAPCRAERTSKYNQLMRIEEELGAKASFAGANFGKAMKL